MSLCCRDIMALSFRKDDASRTRVQANVPGVILSARFRKQRLPRIRIVFPLGEVYQHFVILRRSAKGKDCHRLS
jgi:hypothetical protein